MLDKADIAMKGYFEGTLQQNVRVIEWLRLEIYTREMMITILEKSKDRAICELKKFEEKDK